MIIKMLKKIKKQVSAKKMFCHVGNLYDFCSRFRQKTVNKYMMLTFGRCEKKY